MNKKEELKKLLVHKKSKQFYAKRLGVSVDEIDELLSEIRGVPIHSNSVRHNVDKGEIEYVFYYDHPPTPEEIIKEHKIDTTKYKLSNFWSKQKGKGYQVSALFTKLSIRDKELNSFEEFLKTYNPNYKKVLSWNTNTKFSEPTMLEISLADAHIDKWGLQEESIDEYCNKYYTVLEKLLRKAYLSHNVEEIVFVLGNDLFNTDNIHNATAKSMNPQEVNTRWDKSYEKGFDLMVKSINLLKHYCKKLNVIVVLGNHDTSKTFYLGHALEAFFKNDKNIIFDRTAKPRKIYTYYDTAILYHHGNCKIDQLPLIMASEFPKEWGNTRYHRVHTGDKHFYMEKEIGGVRIKQFPSMSQTDTWHNDNNYILNGRVGLLNVYDRVKGRIAEYEETI